MGEPIEKDLLFGVKARLEVFLTCIGGNQKKYIQILYKWRFLVGKIIEM